MLCHQCSAGLCLGLVDAHQRTVLVHPSGIVTYEAGSRDVNDEADVEGKSMSGCAAAVVPPGSADHDYTIQPQTESSMLAAAQDRITELERELERVHLQGFFLERFSKDPHLVNFYTGFKDYDTLRSVFLSFNPQLQQ